MVQDFDKAFSLLYQAKANGFDTEKVDEMIGLIRKMQGMPVLSSESV